MDQTDCVVIGAGVVGLAIARELAARGRETIVLEAADAIGTGTSSRNSEVIHAGLYYPRGTLKAMSCVRGRELLYEFCETHHVPHRRIGKLIVATSVAQVKQLKALAARAADTACSTCCRSRAPRRRRSSPRSTAWKRCSRRPPASSTATS